jgi:ribonuclease Z
MLDICLLGTGGMVPLPGRWLSSLLVRQNGTMILIDCGEGTQIALKIARWGFKAIDAIIFTHYHADHISGLPGLLLTIGNSGREKPITLMGPPGIKKVVNGLTIISPELPYELRLLELSDISLCQTTVGNLLVSSIPVDHTLTCLSYCIELKRQGKFDVDKATKLGIPVKFWNTLQKGLSLTFSNQTYCPEMVLGPMRKGIKICYCTDTRPTKNLVDFIEDSDLFICEGMYGSDKDLYKAIPKKHMLFSEASLLAKQGKVKELWLTHYSPSLIDPEEYIGNAQRIFKNIIVGKDQLTKSINYSDSGIN